MTNDILEKANENRRQYENCKYILNIVTASAEDDIRISCRTGSFSLASELNGAFIKMVTNFLNKEIATLDKEYKEL